MRLLGFAYRFISNFFFLALVYYSLNSMDKYPQRATLASRVTGAVPAAISCAATIVGSSAPSATPGSATPWSPATMTSAR